MATELAILEDRIVTRLAAITVMLTDPNRQGEYRRRWEDRAAQLTDHPDPVIAPPAGTWMRGAGEHERWHLSSGIAEQPLQGAINGWFRIVPACNRRYEITVAVPAANLLRTYQDPRTVTVGKPGSPRCERCAAIEAGTVKPANWQEAAS